MCAHQTMSGPVRAVAVMLAVGAALAVGGCSAESHPAAASSSPQVAASASAATAAAGAGWDPCSIPAADLSAGGLDPGTKQVGALGVEFPGWDICTWDSPDWYGLNVYSSSSHTYAEVTHNSTLFHDPRPVTVAGRAGTLLPRSGVKGACTIAFDAATPVQLEVSSKFSALGDGSAGDPCAEVTRLAGVLMKDLPAAK